MKHSALTLAFSALLLSASLLHAKLVKAEISNKDKWTVNSCGEFFINVGPEGKEVVWEFDLKGGNAAFKAMTECYTGAEEEPAAGEKISEEEAKALMEQEEPAAGEEISEEEAKALVEQEEPAAGEEISEEEAKALVEQEEPAAAGDEEPLIEHEYARPGDWGVHWFTKGKSDAFAQASMIRYYDDASMLRMTIDATHFHIDVAADWAVLGTTKWKKGTKVKVSVQLAEQADLEPGKEIAILVDDEGDKWLRISQPLDEPSGMQDAVRNGKKMHIVFPSKAKWTFDLKGSHAAWQKVDECMEKHNK